MRNKRLFICAIIAIVFIISHSALAYYDVIDLGARGGCSGIVIVSVNDSGQIVGDSGYTACLFDSTGSGANIYLGELADTYGSIACSINNNGQIVGYAFATEILHACLFDPTGGGNNIDLGSEAVAVCINNNGQIVGQTGSYACLFDPTGGGNNIELGALPGSNNSATRNINDNGQIVGWAKNSSGNIRACIFDPTGTGVNIDLGTLSGQESTAWSINNNGQIAGEAEVSGVIGPAHYTVLHACLFDPTGGGNNVDLGALGSYGIPGSYPNSTVHSINDNGQIVGWVYKTVGSFPTDEIDRACLFDSTGNGNNIDLNTLINPSSGWTLERAYDINNNGWIVGSGINPDGEEHAYLLVVPEPISAVIFGFSAVILSLRRKKQ